MASTRRIVFAGAVGLALLARDVHGQAGRDAYVSDASFVVGTYAPTNVEHTPEAMTEAAVRFLAALDEGQRGRAMHTLESAERGAWTNLPPRPDAGGLRLGACDRAQVEAACALLASVLSAQGFDKVRDIMLGDDQLLRGGAPRPGFGTDNFALVVFGVPSATDPWGLQLDGHHLGINLAIHGTDMTLSPSFVGAQPHAFTVGEREVSPLAAELDDAYALARSLTGIQRDEAIVSARREQLRSGPGRDYQVPVARGAGCSTFDAAQRERLLALIGHWVNLLPEDRAAARMAALANELDDMRFAWSGPTERGSDISFAIQSPSLIIEYAGQGNQPLDHIHTMYRDPTNEYGGQYGADAGTR